VFFFLYGPVEVALPLYVAQDMHGSAAMLGAFWTAFGVGALIGGLVGAAAQKYPLWTVTCVIIIGWGIALLPLGLSDSLIPGLIGFAVGGVIYGPYISITTALFQRTAPPELLSRILATRGALTIPATSLGLLVGGPLTGWLGAQGTLLASGIFTIVLGIFVAVMRYTIAGRPLP
jgi:MFS family permease